MMLEDQIKQEFLGNALWRWLLFALVVASVMIAVRLLRGVAGRRLQQMAATSPGLVRKGIVDTVGRTSPVLVFLFALYPASWMLVLLPEIRLLLRTVAILSLLLQAGIWVNVALVYVIRFYVRRGVRDAEADHAAIDALTLVGRIVVWAGITLLILDNLPGVEITSLVAGLGITGIAVALAVQNILGDLLGSISILLDKPFAVGDVIFVDDLNGTVEHIGLKTTRLRSPSGEQLVFANSDLLASRIRNFKTMKERRVVFRIGVTYSTPLDKLETIPDMIREIVEQHEQVRFDRSHFSTYGDFALIFETAYYVLTADYYLYMDIQQAINLEIARNFEAEGIEFARLSQVFNIQSINS